MKRALAVAVIAVASVTGGACSAGDSASDTITRPIDKAEDTADIANQREQNLEKTYNQP